MPRTMGIFVLLIIILSFVAGAVRAEAVLTLTGAVFLAIWAYCLVLTLMLAMFHRRRAGAVSISLSPGKITAGEWTQVSYIEENEISLRKKIFQLPGILVRCRILLRTKDGRSLTYDFKPEAHTVSGRRNSASPAINPAYGIFQAEKRGAYFTSCDEFAVFDILGFFRFAYRVPAESGARLLVSPRAAGEPVPFNAKGGEAERRGPPIERTDELVDHRPYVPGDDPRRINWKLYGHGGDLFIRQGEREPPPHSNLTILIDTQFDSLYTAKSAPAAVDLLCESALAIINSVGRERDVQVGFSGQVEKNVASTTQAEWGFFLAYPYAAYSYAAYSYAAYSYAELPPVTAERAVLILAAPRITAQSSALDRFISGNANRSIELIFIYGAEDGEDSSFEKRASAAETCASFYNKHPGVTAHTLAVHVLVTHTLTAHTADANATARTSENSRMEQGGI